MPEAGRRALFCLLLLLGAVGCPSAPDSVVPSPVEPDATHGVLTDLYYDVDASGVASVTTPTLTNALAARVTLLGLVEAREGVIEPLSRLVRLVVTQRAEHPLRAAPELFAGAQGSWFRSPTSLHAWLEAGRGGSVLELAVLDGVLARGASAVFEMVDARGAARDPEHAIQPPQLRLWVHRRSLENQSDYLELALAVSGPSMAFKAMGRGASQRHERVVLEPHPLALGEGGFVAILPFHGIGFEAIAVVLEVAEPPASGPRRRAHELACHNWAALQTPSTEPPPASRDPIPGRSDVDRELSRLRETDAVDSQRRSLAALAAHAPARLAFELALAGDDVLVRAIAARITGAPVDQFKEESGMILERASLETIGARVAQGGNLNACLLAMLIDYGGAAAEPAQLLGCLNASKTLEEHEQAIAELNRSCLDDPAPWLQARARVWLKAHATRSR